MFAGRVELSVRNKLSQRKKKALDAAALQTSKGTDKDRERGASSRQHVPAVSIDGDSTATTNLRAIKVQPMMLSAFVPM